MPSSDSIKINIEFDPGCIELLLEAVQLLGEIEKDYPDDVRFKAVAQKVADAIGYGTDCA